MRHSSRVQYSASVELGDTASRVPVSHVRVRRILERSCGRRARGKPNACRVFCGCWRTCSELGVRNTDVTSHKPGSGSLAAASGRLRFNGLWPQHTSRPTDTIQPWTWTSTLPFAAADISGSSRVDIIIIEHCQWHGCKRPCSASVRAASATAATHPTCQCWRPGRLNLRVNFSSSSGDGVPASFRYTETFCGPGVFALFFPSRTPPDTNRSDLYSSSHHESAGVSQAPYHLAGGDYDGSPRLVTSPPHYAKTQAIPGASSVSALLKRSRRMSGHIAVSLFETGRSDFGVGRSSSRKSARRTLRWSSASPVRPIIHI